MEYLEDLQTLANWIDELDFAIESEPIEAYNNLIELTNAIAAIKNRSLYDRQLNKYVFVNKLIYWGDELMIKGVQYTYKVKDYGITWRKGTDD